MSSVAHHVAEDPASHWYLRSWNKIDSSTAGANYCPNIFFGFFTPLCNRSGRNRAVLTEVGAHHSPPSLKLSGRHTFSREELPSMISVTVSSKFKQDIRLLFYILAELLKHSVDKVECTSVRRGNIIPFFYYLENIGAYRWAWLWQVT